MAERFSASDAAFEGFRLARERPVAILVWTGVMLVVGLLTTVLMIVVMGDQLAALTAAEPGEEPSPEAMMQMFSAMGASYGLTLPILLAGYAVLYAAVNRAVLRPAEGGAGFVRLGAQEVRQLFAVLITFVLVVVAYLVGVLVGGIVIAIGIGLGAVVGTWIAVIMAPVGIVLALAPPVFVAVRLSFASPMTFAHQKLEVFESWEATRGRFWPLFGAYLLAFVLYALVYLLGMVIVAALAVVAGGGMDAVRQVFAPDLSSLQAYFTPVAIFSLIVQSLLAALGLAIVAGAAADAYRQIVGDTAVSQVEAFA